MALTITASTVAAGCGGSGGGSGGDSGGEPAAVETAVAERAGPDAGPNIILIVTDDQGYADLGAQGVVDGVSTPNIDWLAHAGVRFTDAYVTAPICAPSRGGLLTGRYQQRYGFETNDDLPMNLTGSPLPERLRAAGYRTGMSGKLHLPIRGRGNETPSQWGFDEFFMKAGNYIEAPNLRYSTHDLAGRPFASGPRSIESPDYHVDADTRSALQFIDRNHDRPFFLYLSYFAPHVPLEAPSHYLSRFAATEPEGRRYALAMISAIDDGIGAILAALRDHDIEQRTLIFFISDNGAPLEPDLRSFDAPVADLLRWNGSLNSPFRGEKDMLLEGGIRVPFVANWQGALPSGSVYREPVSSLDVAATALALAGVPENDSLDGANLIPHLNGEAAAPPHEALFWALGGQAAIRKGRWKLLRTRSSGQYLFDLQSRDPEGRNLADARPQLAARLDRELQAWLDGLGMRPTPREEQLALEARLFRSHLGPE